MEKRNLLLKCILVILCLPAAHAFAQPHATATSPIKDPMVQPVPTSKPMDAFIRRMQQTNKFVQVSNIWQADNAFDKTAMLTKVEDAQPLTIDYAAVANLITQNTTAISLVVPGVGGSTYTIDLGQYSYLTNDFQVHTMSGNTDALFNYTPGKYYSGVVHGIPGSVAAFSFFNNEVYGVFSIPGIGNMVLVPNIMVGKYYNYNTHYVLYNDKDLKILNYAPSCGTDDLPTDYLDHRSAYRTTTTLNNNVYNDCKEVRVMEVGDYALYQTKGSNVANVTNYLTALFNNQATLYRNEGILIDLNYVQVDNTSDLYASITSAQSARFLDKFSYATQNTLHGCDLAILLSTAFNGGYGALGGVAWLQTACTSYYAPDSAGPYAFCDMDNSAVTNFPTYSWDVEVATHEMGHVVGSPHTHRCCWFPQGSGILPIDGCYAVYGGSASYMEGNPPAVPVGSCAIPTPSTPPAGGTIMSYCHLVTGVGINFSNGFGTQPGDTVRSYLYNHLPAYFGSTLPPTCMAEYHPSVALQTAKRTITANRECTDLTSTVTYYWYDNNTADQSDDTLVLMINKNGNNIGNLDDAGFSVTSNTIVRYGNGTGDTLTFPVGTSASIQSQSYGMRRYWSMTPTTEPTTAVEVMYPYVSTDTTDVHGSVSLASAPLTNYLMYQVNSPIDPNPYNNFPGATAGNFTIYTYALSPSTTNWSLSTVGATQLAHFKTTTLAAGGTGFYSFCALHVAPTLGTLPAAPCPGAVATYSVAPDGTATSFTWSVTGTGWSAAPSTTNAVNLTAGTGVATVTVTANDNCGAGNPTTFTITPAPLPTVSIATTSGLCVTDPTASLSSTVTSGGPATGYTWSVSGTGWSASGPTNTATFTVNAGTGTGVVSLHATNVCGTGPTTNYNVTMTNTAPVAATSITPPALVCPSSSGSFFANAVTGATSYTWSVAGTGWTGFSTSNTIIVNVGTGVGTLTVNASNACGTGPAFSRNFTPSTGPGAATAITSGSTPCSGNAETLTTPSVPTASSYIWTVSGTGWSGSSVTNSISVTVGTAMGVITVSPVNACGTGASFTTTISPSPAPTSNFALSSHIVPAYTNIVAFYTGTAPVGSTFLWNFSGGIGSPGTGSGAQTIYWTTPGQYIVFLTVSDGAGCTSATADTVDVLSNTGVQNVNIGQVGASIVPNPNNGAFDVLFSESINQPVSVKLFNMLGQVVYHNDYNDAMIKKISVATNDLPSGTYTLTISVNGSVISKKVTIYK